MRRESFSCAPGRCLDTAKGDVEPLEPPAHLVPETLLKRVKATRNLKWAGEGAHMYIEAIRACALTEGIDFHVQGSDALQRDNEWVVVQDDDVLAASIGKLALRLAPFKSGSSPQDLHAIYVRPSDAELNA